MGWIGIPLRLHSPLPHRNSSFSRRDGGVMLGVVGHHGVFMIAFYKCRGRDVYTYTECIYISSIQKLKEGGFVWNVNKVLFFFFFRFGILDVFWIGPQIFTSIREAHGVREWLKKKQIMTQKITPKRCIFMQVYLFSYFVNTCDDNCCAALRSISHV